MGKMQGTAVSGMVLELMLIGVLTFAFNVQPVKSEVPPMQWQKTYGGTGYEAAFSMIQTSDGGYALAGYTTPFGASSSDFWLVKTNSMGNQVWDKTYGGSLGDLAWSVIQTNDGGYALAGETGVAFGNVDFLLVKTDSAGNQVWSKTYGGPSLDGAQSIIQTSDGGYALAGITMSFGAGGRDFWLVKTDSLGNHVWDKTYGGPNEDAPSSSQSLIQTSDGGYAVTGYTFSFGTSGSSDFLLIKTDPSGNVMWQRTYGGPDHEVPRAVIQTNDGGYAIAGLSQSPTTAPCFWLVKTYPNGTMHWNKKYAGTGDERASSLVQTSNGGYAIAGVRGFWDIRLIKTDVYGNPCWSQLYGAGAENQYPVTVIQTNDGGYAIAGYTTPYANSGDFLLIKLRPVLSATVTITPGTLNTGNTNGEVKVDIQLPSGYSVSLIDISSIAGNYPVLSTQLIPLNNPNTLRVKFAKADVISFIQSLPITLPSQVSLCICGKLNDVFGTAFEGVGTFQAT